MDFFDALLSLGRSNIASPLSPCSQVEALKLMDTHDVSEALVFHTLARDADPESGNQALSREISSPRLHALWAFDPVVTAREKPEAFLKRALTNGVKAFLINPMMKHVRMDRSPRIQEFASLLESRRIPLFVTYRQWDAIQDIVDWYCLADFCCSVPDLPVYAWEWRSRANRPLLDALSLAPNLGIVLSSLWQAHMVEEICECFSPRRLVFSLGLPYLDPGAFPAVMAYAGIEDEAKQAIASDNIRAALGEADYAV